MPDTSVPEPSGSGILPPPAAMTVLLSLNRLLMKEVAMLRECVLSPRYPPTPEDVVRELERLAPDDIRLRDQWLASIAGLLNRRLDRRLAEDALATAEAMGRRAEIAMARLRG